jgi:hypothetical protein
MREGFAFAITDEMIVPAHDFARSPLQESDQPRIRILGQLAIEWFPHRGAGHPARPIDAPLGSFFGLELLEVVTMTSLGSCCVNGKQGDRLAERNHFFAFCRRLWNPDWPIRRKSLLSETLNNY